MFHALILLIAFFFLVSCGDTVIEATEDKHSSSATNVNSNVAGDLFVYAIDAVSGNSISSADFFLPAIDSIFRKSSGISGTVYRNLPVGENYALNVSAAGYTPVICNAAIKFAGNENGLSIPVAENTTLSVPLRKLSSSLRGSVFYQSLANPLQLELFPAAGAEISVIIQDEDDCSYGQKIFGPIYIDKDGFYSFDSLPEMAKYTLIVRDAVLGGILYSGMQSSGTLATSGNATILPRMVYDVAQTAFGFVFNSDNRLTAGKNDTLKLGFSEPVNISLLRNGDLSVARVAGNTKTQVAANFLWHNQNKNLSIAPVFGEWESGQNYEISIKAYSAISSKIIDTVLVFLVNEFSDFSSISISGIKLDNPAVNYNTSSVVLRWNAMANAEAYEIYVKRSSNFENIYSFAGEVTAKTNGVVNTVFTLQASNWFLKNDSAQILIVARNGKGKSAFGEPFVIKDNVRPQFTAGPITKPDTANYSLNVTNAFNSTVAASQLALDVSFNEPMDTSSVLQISIPSQTIRSLDAELNWVSETLLKISFKIGAGELNDSIDTLKIFATVSGLKDKAGNSVKESTAGTKTWQDLLILLHADGVPML